MKYIANKTEFPTTAHFAVLIFDTIYMPGDERSRTNPGHGYGESYEHTIKYIRFDTRDELESWVDSAEKSRVKTEYKVIEVKPLVVQTKVSVL